MKRETKKTRRLVPSGVDWIGDMPEGWIVKRLKYLVASIESGGTPDSNVDEYFTTDGGYDWVNISDMSNTDLVTDTKTHVTEEGLKEKGLKIFEVGTTLYSIYATIGKVSRLGIPACLNQAILALLFEDPYDPKYAAMVLKAYEDKAHSEVSVNTQKNLNSFKVRNFRLPIPPLPEQQVIAAKLDEECGRIDSLTAKIEKEIAALEEYRKSLITKCVTKGLNSKAKLKPSGVDWIGDVPEGWKVMRLSYQYTVQLGKMLDSAQITGEFLVPYLRNQDVQWNRINTDDLPMMDIRPEEYCRCSAKRGDLLVCEGGEIGRSAIWRCDEPVFYQKAIMRLRPFDDRFNTTSWMYYLMCAATSCDAFDNATGKSTIAHLPAEKLQANKFPFPSIDEQREIAAHLDKKCAAIDAVLAKRRKQLEGLAEYRKSVIYAYVTGKKEVAA